MVRISKKKLSQEVEKKLIKQLGSILIAQSNSRNMSNLLYELFTPSERTVFIKRVGIIALLQRNYSHYAVSVALDVSQTTVAKVASRIEFGKYKNISDTLKRKEHRESIIGTIESLLTLGLPGEANRRMKDGIRKDIEAWKSGSK